MVAFVALPALLILLTPVSVPLRVFPVRLNDSSGSDYGSLPHAASPLASCPVPSEPLGLSTPPFGCPGGIEVITRVGVLVDSRGRVADAWLTRDSESGGSEHERCVLDALRDWQYAPARDCEDVPVPFVSKMTFVVQHSSAAERLRRHEDGR
jgi:hypothetical protein